MGMGMGTLEQANEYIREGFQEALEDGSIPTPDIPDTDPYPVHYVAFEKDNGQQLSPPELIFGPPYYLTVNVYEFPTGKEDSRFRAKLTAGPNSWSVSSGDFTSALNNLRHMVRKVEWSAPGDNQVSVVVLKDEKHITTGTGRSLVVALNHVVSRSFLITEGEAAPPDTLWAPRLV